MKALAVLVLALAVPAAAAAQTPPDVRFDNPKTMPQPRGYTHVVEVSGAHRTVYISGQLGVEPSDKELAGFPEQASQVFENIKAALESVGGSWANVVKTNTYVTDYQEFAKHPDMRMRYFGPATPTSTTVQISRLADPDAMIEIEAIAVID